MFVQLFFLTIIQAAGLLLNHIYIEDDNKPLMALYFLILPSLAWYLFVWLYVFIERFSHPGKVCSGDFLDVTDSEKGYLIDTGLFIIFIWRLLSIAIILGVAALCAVLAYIPLRIYGFAWMDYERRHQCTWQFVVATILITLIVGGIILFLIYLCYRFY